MKHLPFTLTLRRMALAVCAVLTLTAMTSCEDEESALGIDLVDPSTLYKGRSHTLYPSAAWSKIEDSLRTSNTDFCIIGNMADAVFGKTSSILYTQVALSAETRELKFDSVVVDSVILTLVRHRLQPDTAGTYRWRFEVKQLAEAIESDKHYYSTDRLPVDESKTFCDSIVEVGYTDSVVRLVLDRSILPILTQIDSANAFARQVKGLRIRILEGSDNGMISVDYSTTETRLTAYYHYEYMGDQVEGEYDFMLGGGPAHFTQFIHDYSGTIFASSDSIDGANQLYQGPLGGHAIHLNFNTDLQAFHSQHPLAVIHHAELLLPTAPGITPEMPERMLVYEKQTGDSLAPINDMIDPYTFSGYDGYYNSDKGHYRLRVTQHLQGLLRQGYDRGVQLVYDGRRHIASKSVINGIADTGISPKIVFVYSE